MPEKRKDVTQIVLNNLQAHSLYFLQVQALAQFGRDRLKGEKAATFLDTASMAIVILSRSNPNPWLAVIFDWFTCAEHLMQSRLSRDELNSSRTARADKAEIL
ncbi:unnamed protein product [Timema podura]|uniref:Uncharacterized protein n=1 Tax=Timema podura TaxID=61482 RepID=A0ABN7PEK8_TIMPD|nr:unnamed protein product [Timema podura]